MEATVAFTRSLSIKANGSIKAELMSVKQSGLNAAGRDSIWVHGIKAALKRSSRRHVASAVAPLWPNDERKRERFLASHTFKTKRKKQYFYRNFDGKTANTYD